MIATVDLGTAATIVLGLGTFFAIVAGVVAYELRRAPTPRERQVARRQGRPIPPPIDGSAIRVIGGGRRGPGPDIDQPLGKERIGR